MQLRVNDEAAVTFSSNFYEAIAKEGSIEESLAISRRAISNLPERSQDWGIPVLYLRSVDQSADHRLFEADTSTAKTTGSNDQATYDTNDQKMEIVTSK